MQRGCKGEDGVLYKAGCPAWERGLLHLGVLTQEACNGGRVQCKGDAWEEMRCSRKPGVLQRNRGVGMGHAGP